MNLLLRKKKSVIPSSSYVINCTATEDSANVEAVHEPVERPVERSVIETSADSNPAPHAAEDQEGGTAIDHEASQREEGTGYSIYTCF